MKGLGNRWAAFNHQLKNSVSAQVIENDPKVPGNFETGLNGSTSWGGSKYDSERFGVID